ncbi:hypothetical protein AX14_003611 [Amanita brunnescens Koide BX004]|nr:hypothetical protein AX14_003611 [Amanita brunnescens Koide BX004]
MNVPSSTYLPDPVHNPKGNWYLVSPVYLSDELQVAAAISGLSTLNSCASSIPFDLHRIYVTHDRSGPSGY